MSRLREMLQQKAGHQLEQQAGSKPLNKKGSAHKSSHKKRNRKY